MTLMIRPPVLALAAGLALAACGQRSAEVAAEPVVLKAGMQEIADRQNDLVNTLIEALDDQGGVDPAKLTEEHWGTLESAAAGLRDAGLALRAGPVQVVAAPGEAIEGEDAPGALGAAEVQARIDQDPAGFRAQAGALLTRLETLAAASNAHDAAAMWEVALDLDAACSGCHMQYWYPE